MLTKKLNKRKFSIIFSALISAFLFSLSCAIEEPTTSEEDSSAASANVIVEETGGQTVLTEGAEPDTVRIQLTEKPEATVSIAIDDGDGQVTVTPSTLVFTEDNYKTPRTVTITAVDDEQAEGNHTATVSIAVAAGDSNYRLLVLPDINISITDNDSAGISFTHTSGATIVSESGIFDSYQVVLTKVPEANVTVTASVSDPSQFNISPGSVTFSQESWATPQTIVVTAIDDPGIEGDVGYSISHMAASSDSNYNGLSLVPLNITVRDDDTVIYVNKLATGSQNGKTWINAYTELSDAVAAAISGQDIWVATGTYTPGINRTDSFNMPAGVDLFGGFVGSETGVNDRNPTANPTVLSGDIDGDDTAPFTGNGNNAYHVIEAENAGTITISGFTVKRGNSDSTFPNERGGGLRIDNSSVTLSQMIFTENSANFGGGVYGSTPAGTSITDSQFLDNHSTDDGAGVYLGGCNNCVFSDLTFDDNDATDLGGGMFLSGNDASLNDITFTDNDATDSGGGLYLYANDDNTVTDINFVNNSAAVNGGGLFVRSVCDNNTFTRLSFTDSSANLGAGMYLEAADGVDIIDSTFTNNDAVDDGGGIYFGNTTNVTISGAATTFTGNDSPDKGGAIFTNGVDGLDISDATFSNNTATTRGGAVYLSSFSNISFTDSTFTNNQTAADGSGTDGNGSVAHATSGANWVIDSCTFTSNPAAGSSALFATAATGIEVRNSDFEGNTSASGSYGGGAIHLWSSATGAILENNTYTSNTGDDAGALLIEANDTTIRGSVFTDNAAVNLGGAIYALGDNLTMEDVEFYGNSASQGGAVFLDTTYNSTVDRAIVIGNSSANDGGGFDLHDATGLSVKNSLFAENVGRRGGALYLFAPDATSNISLQNLTVTNNYTFGTSSQYGAIFFASAGSVLTAYLYNSIVYNNHSPGTEWQSNIYDHGSNPILTFTNNSIGGLIAEFQNNGNIDTDPLFTETPLAVAYTLDGPDGGSSYDGSDSLLELQSCGMVSAGDYIEYDGDGVYRAVTTVDCSGSTSLVFLDGSNPLPATSEAGKLITIYDSATPPTSDYTATEASTIDSGDNNYPGTTEDLAGSTRIVNTTVDMGAFETQ